MSEKNYNTWLQVTGYSVKCSDCSKTFDMEPADDYCSGHVRVTCPYCEGSGELQWRIRE